MEQISKRTRIINLTGSNVTLIGEDGSGTVYPCAGLAYAENSVNLVKAYLCNNVRLCQCDGRKIIGLPEPDPDVVIIVPEEVVHAAKTAGREVSDLAILGPPVYEYSGNASALRGYRYLITAETL